MTTLVYGINNCDTIKKARRWLDENQVDYQFHDYRADGLDEALLQHLMARCDWQQMLNKRSTSYRALSDEQKQQLSEQTVVPLFLETPTLIKRPLLLHGDCCHLGFKAEAYQQLFNR